MKLDVYKPDPSNIQGILYFFIFNLVFSISSGFSPPICKRFQCFLVLVLFYLFCLFSFSFNLSVPNLNVLTDINI